MLDEQWLQQGTWLRGLFNSFSHDKKQGQNMPPLINKFIKQIINRQD